MLGVTGKTLIKWGKCDAVFWATPITVSDTKYIGQIMAKYNMEGDHFCLEDVISWGNMSCLSHVKKEAMNLKVSRKDFYYLIVAEEGVGGEDASEEGEDQFGAMCGDTPSCFDCGRVFSFWQGVNIHSRTCS